MTISHVEVLAAMGRLRRAMPRNEDVLAVCDAAERNVTGASVSNVTASNVTAVSVGNVTGCSVCAARRVAVAERVRRHRASRRK